MLQSVFFKRPVLIDSSGKASWHSLRRDNIPPSSHTDVWVQCVTVKNNKYKRAREEIFKLARRGWKIEKKGRGKSKKSSSQKKGVCFLSDPSFHYVHTYTRTHSPFLWQPSWKWKSSASGSCGKASRSRWWKINVREVSLYRPVFFFFFFSSLLFFHFVAYIFVYQSLYGCSRCSIIHLEYWLKTRKKRPSRTHKHGCRNME